jgi:hypothetical protein
LIITGVFVSLAVAFLIPNASHLTLPVGLRLIAAVVLAFAPIFFANLLFTSRFKDAANPTAAFAANLFGAMVGGCLEYLSLVLGYRWLLAVAALLYLAAVIIGQRQLRKQAAPAVS